jgi:hypothetical protein
MQPTQSKIVALSAGQIDTVAGSRSTATRASGTTKAFSRAVPVMSKERAALFAGIETSSQFTAEALYAAFGSPSQTK